MPWHHIACAIGRASLCEEAVLGALLLDDAAFQRVAGRITAADFYRRDHQLIFGAIIELAKRGDSTSPVDVAELLDERDHLDEAGGLHRLVTLVRETATASTVAEYADRLAQLARLRRLREAAARVAAGGDDLHALRQALRECA